MQHDMASITCPACQCSISVQQILQLHEKHQEAKRRLQLCESQTTILLAWKILDQGREADLQGDLAGAFQLYKEGLARALHAGKLWPATNPIVPMMDHFHSQTMWAMRRSEKISTALAAWASPHPMDVAQLSAAAAAQAGAPSQQGSSSRHKTGVALGTTQGEKPPQLEPVQPAQLPQPMHREFLQLKQVTQQQAQQPQKAAQQQAQHQVAQEPQQQQHRQPEVLDLGIVAWQQKQQQQQQQQQQQLQQQQQQQQLKKQQQQQQQQPEHQHLQKQELGALRTPRQPLGPPPHELLKAKSKAVSDASTKAAKMTRWKEVGPQCVASGDSHQRKRAKMQDEKEEDHEKSDVDIWTFRELSKLELLRD